MSERTVPVTTEETPIMPERESTREEERYLSPPVDIFETAEGLTVVADLPGVEKDTIDVRVENHILTISGKTAHQPKGEMVYKEFKLLNFFRQFELSDHVDQEKISANYRHGVLTVQLPKQEQAKPRQIPINVE